MDIRFSQCRARGKATARSTRIDEASPDTYAARNLVDGKFDKRWISGGGMPEWVQVELPRAERIARVFWSSDRLKGFGGRFGRSIPEHYRIEISLDGEQWRTVASSEGRLPFSEEDRERLLLFAVFTDDEKQAWENAERREAEAKNAGEARQAGARVPWTL
ncbi:MAG: discoidin domain-containing protein [Bryobacterales bacterium]